MTVKTDHLKPWQFKPGQSGNPGGMLSQDAAYRRKWMDKPIPPDALAALKLAPELREMLEPETTFREIIAARTIYEAATGKRLDSVNDRVWPKTEKVEVELDSPAGNLIAARAVVDMTPEQKAKLDAFAQELVLSGKLKGEPGES